MVPLELVAAILLQLRGDTETLSNASLVSSSWCPESRRLLFRSLNISIVHPRFGLVAFSRFLDTSPAIRGLVHELTIRFGHDTNHARFSVFVSIKLLASAVGKLTTLETLRLLGAHWTETMPPITVQSLKTLVLTREPHLPPATIQDIVSWFPSLEGLHIYGGLDSGSPRSDLSDASPPSLPPDLALEVLIIQSHPSNQKLVFLESLKQTRTVDSLKTFEVTLSPIEVRRIGRFVLAVSRGLENLTIRLWNPWIFSDLSPTETWDPTYFSHCTNLRTITFVVRTYDNAPNSFLPSYFNHICHVLSLSKQAPIWKVAFNIESRNATRLQQDITVDDWARVVHTLVDMPHLKVLQLLGQDQQSGPTVNGFEKTKWAPLPTGMQGSLTDHLAHLQTAGINLEFDL